MFLHQVFDQNGDGVIDARELRSAMKNLGEPLSDKELSDMMREADADKDGKICYEGLSVCVCVCLCVCLSVCPSSLQR